MDAEALAETINLVQVVAGLVLLAAVLLYFHRTGRLRRAFAFPPPPASSLTGSHVLLVLVVFMLVNMAALAVFQSLGHGSVPADPTEIAAAGSAPVGTQPAGSAATQLAAATSQPANPRSTAATLAAQAVGEMILIVVALWIAGSTFAGGLAGFGLRTDRLAWDLGWAVVGYLAFWPICLGIAEGTAALLHVLAPGYHPPEHQVLTFLEQPGLSVAWRVLPWVLAGLVAPFFEEVFFRGLLLTWLRDATRSAWLAIGFTGVAFGLIHQPQWHLVPALVSLGLVLGYLRARTGSLTLLVFFHVIFNVRTLVLTALSGQTSP